MKIFSSQRWRDSLARMIAILCASTLAVQAQAKSPRASHYIRRDHEVLTTHGKLEIHRVEPVPGTYEYRIALDGKLADVEAEYGMVAIIDSYPQKGPARIVLLELDTGGSGCPAFFKVIEIKDDGSTVLSKEFGNCNPMARPSFTDGVLRVDIPKIGSATAESWRYQAGKLSKVKPGSSK